MNLRSFLKPCAIAGFLAATFSSAFAWVATGHMVVASIALKNLSPKARAEVWRLLASGPAGEPADFVLAGPWADEERRQNPATAPWHYEDHHFRADGKPPTGHPESENAVWAIEKFSKVLADRSKPAPERAEALRFLIHFVGDIHQPLHATARDTDQEPSGDRGGNDFHLKGPTFPGLPSPVRNLHSLWDFGGGLFVYQDRAQEQKEAEALATKIESEHPRKSIPHVGARDPEAWALESFDIAKRFVYTAPENGTPDDAYLDKTRRISAERVAAAGYRLADLINRCLN